MIKTSTIFTGDNLPILRGMDSESVDLIYLDPPFNSNRHYAAPIGSEAAGAAFKDVWTLADTDDAWWGELAEAHPALYKVIDGASAVGGKADKAYCIYMAIRLLEMHRVLKSTGSIYLHCDPTMSHSLKLVMDAVFGQKHYQNEIAWCYREAINSRKRWNRKHDIIFFYSKTGKWTFNPDEVLEPHAEATVRKYKYEDEKGKYRLMGRGISNSPIRSKRDISPQWEQEHPELVSRHYMRAGTYAVDYWKIDIINQNAKERTGYPTQKPLKLLQRIIKASSKEGDIVLDPFCGCATACLAAESLQRKWIGIDISPKAYELINVRLKNELGGLFTEIIHRTDIPQRIGGQRSKDIKHILFGKQEGICNGCKSVFEFRNFELDHIVARDVGGTDDDSNLQLLCGWCNRKKGKRPMANLTAELIKEGILRKEDGQR